MAQGTLKEITVELVKANKNLKQVEEINTLTNDYLDLSVDTFKQGFTDMIEFFKGRSLKELEEAREKKVYDEKLLAAIEKLDKDEEKKEKEKGIPPSGIGLLLAGLLGVSLGVIRGWLTAIRGFYRLLTPAAIKKAGADALKGIRDIFAAMGKSIGDQIKAIRGSISAALTRFASLFEGLREGRIAKALKNVGDRIRGITTIFASAGKELRDLISGPLKRVTKTFNTIRGYLKGFATTIGNVARVVGRLFAPVVVIMTIWDTVKGFIEGLEKEGIIGGIKGAITGFFNSLIFGPLDMIKDAVAWILDKFGFKNAAEVLKSFSFTKVFTDIINGIFGFVTSVVNWFKKQLGFDGSEMPSITEMFIGLITAPADALKQAVTWLIQKMGFENAASILSSFSFSEIYINIIDGIFGFVISTVDWFKKQLGFDGDEMPSITNVFIGLITAPYEAAKQAIAWIANKLGFDQVKSVLEGFSFKDMLLSIGESLLNVVTMAGDFIVEKFSSAKDTVKNIIPDMDAVSEFMKSSLRNVLPVNDASKKWYDVRNLVAKAIPNSVYEFAGLDPKTGELITPPAQIRNVGMSNEMGMANEEQRQLTNQGVGGSGGSIISSSNTTNNVSSSTTTVVQSFPSAVRKPDNISDVLFGVP
jgi:hypothetical protein